LARFNALLLACLACALGGRLAADPAHDALVHAGNLAYLRHDLAAAAKDYFEAARLDRSDAGSFYGVAACEYLLGRTTTARVWTELSLARDPAASHTKILLQRLGGPPELPTAQQALDEGRWADARDLFTKSVQAVNGSGLAWRGLALAEARLGEVEQATEALKRAQALDLRCLDLPPVAKAVDQATDSFLQAADPFSFHTRRGVRRFREGDAAGAAADFAQACALQAGDAQAWYHLALARFRLNDGPGTLQALQRCLALDPGHPGALFLQASYLSRSGQAEQARQALAALASQPDARGFGALAGRALSELPPPGADGLHAYVHLLEGPQWATTNNGVSNTTQPSAAGQDYLHLSWAGGSAGWHPWALSGGLYLTPLQDQGQAFTWSQPFESVDALQRVKASTSADWVGEYTGSMRQANIPNPTYYSNAAKVELDGRWLGLQPLAIGAQALAERFPTYSPYDSNSALGTLAATLADARGDLAILTLGYRNNQAFVPEWSYFNGSATLYARLALPWQLALAVTGVWTPQRYPQASDGSGGVRNDVQRYLNPELSRGLPWGLALLLGGQLADTVSNVPVYSSRTVLGYLGLSWSR